MWMELRQRRKAAGLTLDQLADLSGVSKSVLSRLERGIRDPRKLHLTLLAGALKCTEADLLTPFATSDAPPSNAPGLSPPVGAGQKALELVLSKAEAAVSKDESGKPDSIVLTLEAEGHPPIVLAISPQWAAFLEDELAAAQALRRSILNAS